MECSTLGRRTRALASVVSEVSRYPSNGVFGVLKAHICSCKPSFALALSSGLYISVADRDICIPSRPGSHCYSSSAHSLRLHSASKTESVSHLSLAQDPSALTITTIPSDPLDSSASYHPSMTSPLSRDR